MKKVFFLIAVLSIILLPKISTATSGACSYHGGVDCGRGWQANGRVYCIDGWSESITYYDFTAKCQKQTPSNCSGYSPDCKYLNNENLLKEKKSVVSAKIQKELNSYNNLSTTNLSDYLNNLFKQQEIILTIHQGRLIGNYMDYLCSCKAVDEVIQLYEEKANWDSVIKEAVSLLGSKETVDQDAGCKESYGPYSYSVGNGGCKCQNGYLMRGEEGVQGIHCVLAQDNNTELPKAPPVSQQIRKQNTPKQPAIDIRINKSDTSTAQSVKEQEQKLVGNSVNSSTNELIKSKSVIGSIFAKVRVWFSRLLRY